MSEKLVEVKDLEISFGEGKKKFVAVKNANFFINRGETFSLVGESGSGKTTIGRAIIGLNETSKGEIFFDGKQIVKEDDLPHSETVEGAPFSPADVPDFITAVDFEEYMVSKGDTVSGIIQKFGLKNLGTLLSVNGISSAKKLRIGQKLIIPSIDGLIYTAVKGDSLSSIAGKFNLSINAILDANDLENQTVRIGQKLFIPGAMMSSFELKKALGELFIYPVIGRLTSPFGYRRDPFTGRKSFHTGIDIASPTGTPIKLTLDGTVSYTGYSAVYGNYVIVTHSGGYQSMYGHMHTIKVRRGQVLNQGGIIGTVGNTGRSTGPHVHFSIYKNGKLINPLTVLK